MWVPHALMGCLAYPDQAAFPALAWTSAENAGPHTVRNRPGILVVVHPLAIYSADVRGARAVQPDR